MIYCKNCNSISLAYKEKEPAISIYYYKYNEDGGRIITNTASIKNTEKSTVFECLICSSSSQYYKLNKEDAKSIIKLFPNVLHIYFKYLDLETVTRVKRILEKY